MNRQLSRGLIGGAALALVFLAGPEALQASDVPPQHFSAKLLMGQEAKGAIQGAVLFPSEYSQRSVTLKIDERTFVTYPDGRFAIDRLPSGRHKLVVNVTGYETLESTVNLQAGQIKALKPLKLKMAKGRIVGRLVHANGSSAPGVTIKLQPQGAITATDKDGIFEFIGVSGGTHTLMVDDLRYRETVPLQVSLQANATRNMGFIPLKDSRPPDLSVTPTTTAILED